MFSTCIHCTADLGRNEALERFTVGTRLAFDPRLGRLWVVCRACARWNLSPLEERWEAIEEAERRFRDSRLRVSTDQIGLARLREGLDLIRIGEPQRPEMAAWRYGDQFGRRRNRQLLVSTAVVGSVLAIGGGMMAAGVSIASFIGIYANGGVWDGLVHGYPETVVARVAQPGGPLLKVRRKHARMSTIARSDGAEPLWLRLEHEKGSTMLHGDDAARTLVRLLPTVNRFGGSREDVTRAVDVLASAGDPLRVIDRLQRTFGATREGAQPSRTKKGQVLLAANIPGTLRHLPVHQRLALEMALHEERERRALEGELAELTRAWAEAEEIAGIADNLLVTPSLDAKLGSLRDASIVAPMRDSDT